MHKSRLFSFVALGFVLLSVGCDKVCKSTVQDFATVQNTTGRQLTLNVCKGRSYGKVQALVDAHGVSQEVPLGFHEGTAVKGGLDATKSCADSQSTMELRISLAPASFGQVKLCYNETSKLNVVVENYQPCPSGYLEQTATGSCETF